MRTPTIKRRKSISEKAYIVHPVPPGKSGARDIDGLTEEAMGLAMERLRGAFALVALFSEPVPASRALVHAAASGDRRALAKAINDLLEPFRERRAYYLARPELVREALAAGTAVGKRTAEETMALVRDAIGLDYLADHSRWWPPST